MTDTYICLGQVSPAAGTLTTLYTVPTSTSTTMSTLVISNVSSSGGATDMFRVSIAIGSVPDNISQYLYYDVNIGKQDTFCATLGLTMAAGDVVRVQSANGTCTFQAFGIQIT